tara:strand:+ start:396 stop:572 length:177 start_codon:yes stop_codon:yes gene_type:complete
VAIPKISEITKSTAKIQNKVLAMLAVAPAMPPNPKIAAIKETIKNANANLNMSYLLFL